MPLGRSWKTRWLKLNGTYQLLAYADNVNLLGVNTDTLNKNKDSLIYASKEDGLEVHIDETKCTLLSSQQNARKIYKLKAANRSFVNIWEQR
jgi:hypothetical protein